MATAPVQLTASEKQLILDSIACYKTSINSSLQRAKAQSIKEGYAKLLIEVDSVAIKVPQT